MVKKTLNLLSEFSIPLIGGVLFALVFANLDEHLYHEFLEYPLLGEHARIFGHTLNFHFLMNDIFMVLFFGIAAVEITQAVLPGGSLNPITRAVNPLLGTLGGVLGPVGVYFALCYALQVDDVVYKGWGIPTATDIALAWLVARLVFGNRHPAVSFLLLLAVADDAIGLGIIAIFYPDPLHPVEPLYLLLTALGVIVAFGLRAWKVKSFWPYVLIAGSLSWCGLLLAHLHPALAYVFVVPFMPAGHGPHAELFAEEHEHTTLTSFEHAFKIPVDLGLFGFGLANAGVSLAGISEVTWIVLASLLVGKTLGITLFSKGGQLLGFNLPEGMNLKTLFLAALVAGLGLTVALFVSQQAFSAALHPEIQGAAKMGALLSAGAAVLAIFMGWILRVKKIN
jgi:NhaA family Na+:H+ antiporter